MQFSCGEIQCNAGEAGIPKVLKIRPKRRKAPNESTLSLTVLRVTGGVYTLAEVLMKFVMGLAFGWTRKVFIFS